MADSYTVYLHQPNRSATVHRVSARYVHCFTTSNNSCFLLIPMNSYSRYAAKFSNGVVIESDSIAEYELLANQGYGNPGFISWFKRTVTIIHIYGFICCFGLFFTNIPILSY